MFFLTWWVGMLMVLVLAGLYALALVVVPELAASAAPELHRFGAPLGVLVVGVVGFLTAVFNALVYALFAAIGARVYNGLAGVIGGFEVEFEAIPPPADSSDSGRNSPPPPAET